MLFRVFRGCGHEKYFALRSDLLLSTVTKVGKNTGRNLRFLHLRARYILCELVTAYHTFTKGFLFCLVKRIVSASAPLPLMPTPNSAFSSTAASHERQRRKTGANASYVTKSNISRERAVNGHKFAMSTACRKSRNLGFWLSFWSLLGQRPKVTRPGGRNSPHTKIKVNTRSGSY